MSGEARLRALLAGGESDRVEFTNSLSRSEEFAEAVCAFADDFDTVKTRGSPRRSRGGAGRQRALTGSTRRIGEQTAAEDSP